MPRLESVDMSAMVAAGRRHLPRGWSDLGRQLAIWFGFAVLYQLARGFADRNPAKAFDNGQAVFNLELKVPAGDTVHESVAVIANVRTQRFVVSVVTINRTVKKASWSLPRSYRSYFKSRA